MKTNGNAETAGIEKPRQHNFLRLWGGLVQRTFPFMEEEVGELGPKARLFVTVCETVVKPETFKYAKWKGVGPHVPFRHRSKLCPSMDSVPMDVRGMGTRLNQKRHQAHSSCH